MPKQNVDEKQISYMYKQFKLNSKKHIVHNTIMLLAVRVILIFITWWNLRVGKMKRILRSDRLPEWAGWAHLVCVGFPACFFAI